MYELPGGGVAVMDNIKPSIFLKIICSLLFEHWTPQRALKLSDRYINDGIIFQKK